MQRKTIEKLVVALAIIILTAIGMLLIVNSYIDPPIFSLTKDMTRIAGVILTIIGLIGLGTSGGGVLEERSISFQSDTGETRVAFKAIEDFIKKLAPKIDGIVEIKPRLVGSRNQLYINNVAILEADTNISEVTEELRINIKKHIQDVMGIDSIASINIDVAKVIPQTVKKVKSPEEKEKISPEQS
jgi:uncharacterized alkaline shock family protein YloU